MDVWDQNPKPVRGGRAVIGDRGPKRSADAVLAEPVVELELPTHPRASTWAVAVVGVLGRAVPNVRRNAARVGVIPDGRADSLFRLDDDDNVDPVVSIEEIEVVRDDAREPVEDMLEEAPWPPIRQSAPGTIEVGLATWVVLSSIVDGVEGTGTEDRSPLGERMLS